MSDANRTTEISARENIRIAVHDTSDLRGSVPGWDDLDKQEQLKHARNLRPVHAETTSNITTTDLHELIVDLLHVGGGVDEEATHLAVGDDDTTPAATDSQLSNEVFRVAVTDATPRGNELFTSTFLDSTEANGFDLSEVGLVTSPLGGSDILLNRSLISTIQKDSESTATIDVALEFDNP